MLYHLALVSDWEAAVARGRYEVSTIGVTLAEEGFIHTSFAHQAAGVAERFYGEVTAPLVLLHIDETLLDVPWRIDPVPGDDTGFPHLYGPLSPSAVTKVTPVRRLPEGTWEGLPG